jgi:hypothetical protein
MQIVSEIVAVKEKHNLILVVHLKLLLDESCEEFFVFNDEDASNKFWHTDNFG